MKKKILLVLTPQNLSSYLYKRLGVGIKFNKYQILYWNLLPLINKDLNKSTLNKIKKKNYINIDSFNTLRKQISLLPANFFFWNTCGYRFISSILDRILSIIGGKKIFIEAGTLPDTSEAVKKNYKNYINLYFNKDKYFLFKKIKSKFFTTITTLICKKLITSTANIYFATNERTYLLYKNISNGKNVFRVDVNEIVNLKNLNKNHIKNKKKIVFIDQELENPFDQQLNYKDVAIKYNKKDYWSKLDILFNEIEKNSKINKINIAAHPRRKKKNFPSNRKFIYDKTPKLIAESKLVLAHHSFAIHYAILLRKPILFIYSSKMERINDVETILTLAKATGSIALDLEKINKNKKVNLNFKKIYKFNEKKYKDYENNYICYNNQVSYGRWKTILRHLISIK